MTPIFNEFITYIKTVAPDSRLDIIKEGYYWLDRNIVKAFNSEGELIKIVRLQIQDNLEASLKWYSSDYVEPESWQDTLSRHDLSEIEKNSIELIKDRLMKFLDHTPIVLTSTGKDSEVVRRLVEKCCKPRILFNNTSLDCAQTYRFVKSIDNAEIINPTEGFYQWRERNNFVPTRMNRACCDVFKEGAMITYLPDDGKFLFFLGMRNEESASRSTYQDDWKNMKWGSREWEGVLPIREWTELEIWLYILKENIQINEKYKSGYNRVGCSTACPFYTKTTWSLDRYWYPKMYDRWKQILDQDFVNNNKDMIMNCTQEEYQHCWNGGVYRPEPTDEIINAFAERNGFNIELASKYFNHRCCEDGCDKKIRSKEIAAMNMKYFGRHIEKFRCKKHLMETLDIKKVEWDKNVKMFKAQGCELF